MGHFENLLGELESMFDDNGRDTGETVEGAEGTPMAKSFKLKLDDGTEVDAVDGTGMLKALGARDERGAAALTKVFAILNARGEMLKSLQGDVARLSGAGGRAAKAREIAKSAASDVTPEQFFAKALSAQAAGKLSSEDIARAESHLNRGLAVPTDIVARVYGDTN
jgi:hypothetical protein